MLEMHKRKMLVVVKRRVPRYALCAGFEVAAWTGMRAVSCRCQLNAVSCGFALILTTALHTTLLTLRSSAESSIDAKSQAGGCYDVVNAADASR